MIHVPSRFSPSDSPSGRENARAPASLLGQLAGSEISAAGDRVGVLAARRQPMLVPEAAAVPGTEDLTLIGHMSSSCPVWATPRDLARYASNAISSGVDS